LEHKENGSVFHTPVLADRIVAWLQPRPGGRYVDCTLGPGGLAAKILERTEPDGFLIGIDRDEKAIEMAQARLAPYAGRTHFIHGNFVDLKRHLSALDISSMDGVVFDLGVSSAQLAQASRGFSFLSDGPLDMRMDQTSGESAAELVNRMSEVELADLIYRFGEERYARRIARGIARARTIAPLLTTKQLEEVIYASVPATYRHGRIHCATRTFQAFRIAANRELEILEPALRDAAGVLAPQARLTVVSFHSLEDRIAKQTFKALSQGATPVLTVLTKRPETPSEDERHENPRARSAKLRVAERRVS